MEILSANCGCLNYDEPIKEIYEERKFGKIFFKCEETSFRYSYYLRTCELYSATNKHPIFYSDYHQNLILHNYHLINALSFSHNNLVYQEKIFKRELPHERKNAQEEIERFNGFIHINNECDNKIRCEFRKKYQRCYERGHQNSDIFFDFGFLEFIEGNSESAAEHAQKYLNAVKNSSPNPHLDSIKHSFIGQAYLELSLYSNAIDQLTLAIESDPTNKSAYFHRSVAHFETGNFDLALQDYINSDKGSEISNSFMEASDEFIMSLLSSLRNGMSDGASNFVPSLCHSAYGLGTAIWAVNPLNQEALQNTKNFVNACYEMTGYVVECCKTIDWNTVDDCVDQMKTLYERFDQLSDSEKGELIGYTVGKYGVDILAPGALVKGVATFRNLKNANRMCNFEAIVLSQTNKENLIASSIQHSVERENYFKNVKIHWDKQNKHIPGKHNFLHGRGTITLEPNDFETLTKKYVGKGQRVEGSFGDTGYVERLDFGIIIGKYAEKVNGEIKYTPTSKGIIKYAKDGTFHVIPSNPEAIIK